MEDEELRSVAFGEVVRWIYEDIRFARASGTPAGWLGTSLPGAIRRGAVAWGVGHANAPGPSHVGAPPRLVFQQQ